MNCPECGHPIAAHKQVHELVICDLCEKGQVGRYYYCEITITEIERDAWKAEAVAARSYIKMLERYMEGFFGEDSSLTIEEMEKEIETYLAARVVDNPPPDM